MCSHGYKKTTNLKRNRLCSCMLTWIWHLLDADLLCVHKAHFPQKIHRVMESKAAACFTSSWFHHVLEQGFNAANPSPGSRSVFLTVYGRCVNKWQRFGICSSKNPHCSSPCELWEALSTHWNTSEIYPGEHRCQCCQHNPGTFKGAQGPKMPMYSCWGQRWYHYGQCQRLAALMAWPWMKHHHPQWLHEALDDSYPPIIEKRIIKAAGSGSHVNTDRWGRES